MREEHPFGYNDCDLRRYCRRPARAVPASPPQPTESRRLAAAWSVARLGLVVVALLVSGGCAARTAPPATGSVEEFAGRLRELGVRARPVSSGSAATLEAQDPRLSAALLELRLRAGPEQHRRAAARFHELGILDAAHDHYARARQLDPTDAAAHEGLARIWRDWGFPHLALGDAQRSVYYAPGRASAHNTLGTVFTKLGRLQDARRAYERARTLDPGAAYVLSNLCYVSFLEGRSADAIADCQAALTADPRLIAARNNLALAYAAAGQRDRAQEEFLAAGDAAAAMYNLGIVRLAEKQYAKASEAFEAAQRQRPSWAEARERATKARALTAAHGEAASP